MGLWDYGIIVRVDYGSAQGLIAGRTVACAIKYPPDERLGRQGPVLGLSGDVLQQ